MPLPRKSIAVPMLVALGVGVSIGVWLFKRPPAQNSPTSPSPVPPPTAARTTIPATLEFEPEPIGAPVEEFQRPWVTHLDIVDLDRDGRLDVVYCEAQKNTVRWIRQEASGTFTESVIAGDVAGPAHVAFADLYGRGRNDVLVASMGRIPPTNDPLGAVVILENKDNRRFEKRTVLARVSRVSDVRAANIAGHKDGRLDLIVGQFGYNQGETRWMRNLGDWKFESHILNTLSGCIHVPVDDLDGDGDHDFVALISQEWEEVHLYRHRGDLSFEHRIVWGSTNEDFGSSGLALADVNRDGRSDLIYTNGDGFDYASPGPRRWHGMQWLENRGDGAFTYHRVGDLGGAYAPCAADFNGDGHTDLLAVSCFGDWSRSDSPSMVAWLNDGQQNFTPVVLARTPTHLLTAATADLDGDGVTEIVTGGLHMFPPWDRMSNITLWRRKN